MYEKNDGYLVRCYSAVAEILYPQNTEYKRSHIGTVFGQQLKKIEYQLVDYQIAEMSYVNQ